MLIGELIIAYFFAFIETDIKKAEKWFLVTFLSLFKIVNEVTFFISRPRDFYQSFFIFVIQMFNKLMLCFST